MTAIHLDPGMVPAAMRAGYDGRKFQAIVCEQVTIPMDAGLWSGGSRETYRVIRMDDGATVDAVNHNAAPWNNSRREITVRLEPGICVVQHSMFCGKDMGLRFYVHADNAAKLLPAPTGELSNTEKMVLDAAAGLKSSYQGKDRYQMTADNMRYSGKTMPSRADWDAAKASLIGKGLLNKAGAITTSGRNARPSRY